MNKCAKCGSELNKRQAFCPKCGEEVRMVNNSTTLKGVDASGHLEEKNPIVAYINMFKKMFDFDGRCSRREFWYVYLIHTLVGMVYSNLGHSWIVSTYDYEVWYGMSIPIRTFSTWMVMVLLFVVEVLLIWLPKLSLTIRRLHDTGKSGTFCLLEYGPNLLRVLCVALLMDGAASLFWVATLVGQIVIFTLCLKKGEVGTNQYGYDPKGRE